MLKKVQRTAFIVNKYFANGTKYKVTVSNLMQADKAIVKRKYTIQHKRLIGELF